MKIKFQWVVNSKTIDLMKHKRFDGRMVNNFAEQAFYLTLYNALHMEEQSLYVRERMFYIRQIIT